MQDHEHKILISETLFGAVHAIGPVWKAQSVIQLIKVENELIIYTRSAGRETERRTGAWVKSASTSFSLQKGKSHKTTAHCTAERNTALSHVKCCESTASFTSQREGVTVMEQPFCDITHKHSKKHRLPLTVSFKIHFKFHLNWKWP